MGHLYDVIVECTECAALHAASVANFGVVGTGLSTGSSTPEEGNTPRSALARMFSMSSPFRPKQAAAPSNLGPQLPAVS